VRVFRQKFTLEDAIGSHACSLEASRRVTNGISLGSSLFLPVDTVNCVQTLKVMVGSSVRFMLKGGGGACINLRVWCASHAVVTPWCRAEGDTKVSG
jgi:hypothetical protein